MLKVKAAKEDPYFSEIPWDIITNEYGEVIGEVYKILPDPPPRKRQKFWEGRDSFDRKNSCS